MNGRARARCAVSVVNALAAGRGASAAIDLFVEAEVALREGEPAIGVEIRPESGEDPTLAREVARRVLDRLGLTDLGAQVTTDCPVPASMGLKTSSAAANAVALATSVAAQRYDGEALPTKDLLTLGIDAALAAGVTVTGAFDDASASARGGLCVTDNRERALLARHELPPLVAVIHLPGGKIRKRDAAKADLRHAAPVAALAADHALRGDWRTAMTLNGLAFGSVYGTEFALLRSAIGAGALAASVTGTGPAVAAVCDPDGAKSVEEAWATLPGRRLVAPLSNRPQEVLP